MLDEALLDDGQRLADADTSGLLRASASAGAQVRATADAAAEAGVDGLAGSSPRALVVLTRPGLCVGVGKLVTALLGPGCPVPVVAAATLPSWVGALDAVLAHTDDPGDLELAESVDRAGRRGASVVVTAPADGPVAAASSSGALLVPARVPVPPGFGFARALAAALATVRALGLFTCDLEGVATALDAEAERNQPGTESFVNPAKSLALRLDGRTPLLWGTDPLGTAVAQHAAQACAAHAGLVCDASDAAAAGSRPALRAAALSSVSGQDIFADPDVDGLHPRVRLLLFAVGGDDGARRALAAAQQAFDGAEVVSAADELPDEAADQPDLAGAMTVALRVEMAALYLGLASGVAGGPGTLASARA